MLWATEEGESVRKLPNFSQIGEVKWPLIFEKVRMLQTNALNEPELKTESSLFDNAHFIKYFQWNYAYLNDNFSCVLAVHSQKRMSLNADTNTPSIVVLYFRPKVSFVVHRKRAIEMFSKFPEGTKTNSGFRRQSMLLISYAGVPRKCHSSNWYTWSEWITADELMRFWFLENFYFWTVNWSVYM